MIIIDATCCLEYTLPGDVHAIFMLRPRSGGGQWIISEEFTIQPCVPVVEYTDFYGNLCQRMIMPKGTFHYSMKCRARVSGELDSDPLAQLHQVEQLPVEVLHYLLPSRYCQSDKLGDLATSIVGTAPSSHQHVSLLRDWIHDNIVYERGTSNSSTSALETVSMRRGVCRDFAHLGIALCRAINVPARMVVGFVHGLDPMDLHAWFEAYIGGRWFTFDAIEDHPGGNRIVIAYGQDAADVALASLFGRFTCTTMKVTVALSPDTEES
ncbi:MAG: transglutaminase family protein [Prosthecobacter sp.]